MPEFQLYHSLTRTKMTDRPMDEYLDALTEAISQPVPGLYSIVTLPMALVNGKPEPPFETIRVDDPLRIIAPFDPKGKHVLRFAMPPPTTPIPKPSP